MAFIYDLTDTWNAGGTTFSAIKMNVTDTASAAASKLVQCQIGGTDRFTVGKDGGGYFAGDVGIGLTSPQDKLHVAGDIRIDNATYFVSEDTVGSGVRMLGINGSNVAYVGPIDAGPTSAIYNASSTSVTAAFYTTGTERMRIDSSGNVGIGTTSPTEMLDVNSDAIRIRTAQTPASAAAAGNAGDICWDANYIYVCVAANTWKRSALSTW